MASKPSLYLTCYDIRCPRRLQRLARTMKHWGLRLQYSVFLCEITRKQLGAMSKDIRSIIDQRVDDVRIYSLRPRARIHVIGPGPLGDSVNMLEVDALFEQLSESR